MVWKLYYKSTTVVSFEFIVLHSSISSLNVLTSWLEKQRILERQCATCQYLFEDADDMAAKSVEP